MNIKFLIGMALLATVLTVSATTFAAGEIKIINRAGYITETTIATAEQVSKIDTNENHSKENSRIQTRVWTNF